jgi:hypothetical protein
VKPEQAPKGQSWKPTWLTYREGHVSSEKVDFSIAGRSTGVVGAACMHTVRCATREAWSKRDGDLNTPLGRGEGQESEGPTVPMKRVTTVEGRGPGSGCFTRRERSGTLA